MSKLSRLSRLGLAKETTQGTAVTPTFYIPWESLAPEDVINPIRDESMRANDSVLQGQYAGAAESTFAFGGKLYPDVAGYLFRALGLADTVTGSGPYVHTFKSNNTPPPSFTLTDDDGLQARAFPGQMLNELGIKIDAASDVTYDTKWNGWPSATATTTTPTYSSLQPFLGWQLTWSANAVSSTRVLSADLTFKRAVDVIAASDGTQGPRETFAGGIEFAAKGKALFEDETDLNRFLTYAQQAVVCTLTQPGGYGGASLVVTATKSSWNKATKARGDKYVSIDFEIDGVYNSTDAGPCSVVLTNSVTPAY